MTKKYLKTLVLGAAATAALGAANTHAQSADAIISKLVEKGILTTQEAQDLTKESDKDFSHAFLKNTGMADWVEALKFNGDFRGRMDYQGSSNGAVVDRTRWRYRVRAGVTAKLADDFEVNLTLGSGDGNPLSNNQTLQSNGTKKSIWVDKAYAKWSPIHGGDWTLSSTIGKMGNPFEASPMLFDPDYTPEGAALQVGYKINDQHSLKFNGAAFVLDELSGSTHDPYMVGGQAIWNAKWTSRFESSVGISAYSVGSDEKLAAGLHNGNSGNTVQGNFNPYVISGSVTYKIDNFPLYKGTCPIKLAGEYMENPSVSSNNQGYWIGGTIGKSGKRGLWDLSYRYQRLEADAWFDGFVDDDNVAYVSGAGLAHGTNIKGHLVKLNYSITDALTFTLTGYFNELINGGPSDNSGTHIMADLMWKF